MPTSTLTLPRRLRQFWPLGPIFAMELRQTARRRRTYLLRFFYLGLLLAILSLAAQAMSTRTEETSLVAQAQQRAELGHIFLAIFAIFSVVAMHLIAPVLTSTAIGKYGNVEWNTVWGTDIYLPPASSGADWTDLEWYFGGGGGTSAIFAQPWYQRGTVSRSLATTLPDGTRTSAPMRTVPDVSMDADPYTGFQMGMSMTLADGSTGVGIQPYGGTSLASPLFAGLQADVMQLQHGEPVGFANPALYARYGSPLFSDVTGKGAGNKAYNDLPTSDGTGTDYAVDFGDDQLLKATPGYDVATGIGAPNALYLWSHLIW